MGLDGDEVVKNIFVGGWPKSGTTWLARLLGDVLDSPVGGSVPEEDLLELGNEGWDRPGPYIIRKGHYRLIGETAPIPNPSPHALHWRALSGEPVFFIVRDPRGIAVSHSFYFEKPLDVSIDKLITGSRKLPSWDCYVRQWLDAKFERVIIRYESLLAYTGTVLINILRKADIAYDPDRLTTAVERQSFENRKQAILDGPEDVPFGIPGQLHLLRKGIAGDWRNYFTPQMNDLVEEHFGDAMKELGYL